MMLLMLRLFWGGGIGNREAHDAADAAAVLGGGMGNREAHDAADAAVVLGGGIGNR